MFDDEQIQSELLSKQVMSISQLYWSWCWHWDAINKHVTKLLHSGPALTTPHQGQFVSTCYTATSLTHHLAPSCLSVYQTVHQPPTTSHHSDSRPLSLLCIYASNGCRAVEAHKHTHSLSLFLTSPLLLLLSEWESQEEWSESGNALFSISAKFGPPSGPASSDSSEDIIIRWWTRSFLTILNIWIFHHGAIE